MTYKKLIFYIILLLVIADALLYISNSGFGDVFFTPISLVAKFTALGIIMVIAKKSTWGEDIPNRLLKIFKLLMMWNIISIIYGAFTANSYWDWKFLLLTSSLFMLIPLAFFIGKNLVLVSHTVYYVLNFLFVYGFFMIPISLSTNEELYSRLMIPVSIFIVFIPYLRKKPAILVLIVAVTSFLLMVTFRTNVIKISIGFIIVSTFYLRSFISLKLIKSAWLTLFITPLILLFLGVSGTFNLFEEMSKKDGYRVKTSAGQTENLAADTRTFLYVEVFNTLIESNSWITGKGAVGKYKTIYFTDLITGNMRYGSEVGFLNTFLYSGIIGVVAYAVMLMSTSYYAIFKSRNWISKMLGLTIASRWVLYFLEEFTQFDLNFFFLWFTIGLISSKKFRSMTDKDVAFFFSSSTGKHRILNQLDITKKPKQITNPISTAFQPAKF